MRSKLQHNVTNTLVFYATSGSRNTPGAFSINHSIASALPAMSANSRFGSLDRIRVAKEKINPVIRESTLPSGREEKKQLMKGNSVLTSKYNTQVSCVHQVLFGPLLNTVTYLLSS